MVFTTEGLFEVAIESWPEWDLNPPPLNPVQCPILFRLFHFVCVNINTNIQTYIYIHIYIYINIYIHTHISLSIYIK